MNSIERITAAINFEKPDRIPVVAQIFGHAAVLAGMPLGEYLCDGKKNAECQINALERYGHDAVFALMDVNVETEAVGSRLKYSENEYFSIDSYAVSDKIDIDKLEVPNPEKAGRMPELLKAARLLRREVGDDVVVVGNAIGPLTITTQLLGMEKALYLAMDYPDVFVKLLDFSTEVCMTLGNALIQSGAHLVIVFDPSASSSVVPPGFFRELELPRLKKVFASFKQAGSTASWLHVAGQIKKILPYYPEIGVDIANIDYYVSPEDVKKILPNMCVNGNIKSLSFTDATPEGIASESANLLGNLEDRGGFILSSGCEIMPNAHVENIEAMVAAVR